MTRGGFYGGVEKKTGKRKTKHAERAPSSKMKTEKKTRAGGVPAENLTTMEGEGEGLDLGRGRQRFPHAPSGRSKKLDLPFKEPKTERHVLIQGPGISGPEKREGPTVKCRRKVAYSHEAREKGGRRAPRRGHWVARRERCRRKPGRRKLVGVGPRTRAEQGGSYRKRRTARDRPPRDHMA